MKKITYEKQVSVTGKHWAISKPEIYMTVFLMELGLKYNLHEKLPINPPHKVRSMYLPLLRTWLLFGSGIENRFLIANELNDKTGSDVILFDDYPNGDTFCNTPHVEEFLTSRSKGMLLFTSKKFMSPVYPFFYECNGEVKSYVCDDEGYSATSCFKHGCFESERFEKAHMAARSARLIQDLEG